MLARARFACLILVLAVPRSARGADAAVPLTDPLAPLSPQPTEKPKTTKSDKSKAAKTEKAAKDDASAKTVDKPKDDKAAAKTDKPAAKDDKAAAKTDKPAAKDDKAAAKTDKPAAKDDKAAAKTDKPAAKDDKAAAKTDKPAAKDDASAKAVDKPKDDKAAAKTDKPAAKDDASAKAVDKPKDDKAAAKTDKPAAKDDASAKAVDKPKDEKAKSGQGGAGLGLDLSEKSPASLGLDLSEDDFTKGPTVVAVPPLRGDGKPDLPSYKMLHQALKERLGARLVGEEATLKAIDQEKLRTGALSTSEGIAKLAATVKAERVIAFKFIPLKIEVAVHEKPDAPATVEIAFPWTKKTDQPKVRAMMGDLLKASREVLTPPAPAPLPPPLVAAAPTKQEAEGDVGEEASREKTGTRKVVHKGPMTAPFITVLAGGGMTTRSLTARTDLLIAPRSRNLVMPSMGFDLAFYPLRLVPSVANTLLSDFAVEGYYRRTFAEAQLQGGQTDGATCKVDDDEVVARASWRIITGKNLPHIGLGVGWSSERVLMHCASPALSTHYVSLELHLRLMQPILGEHLAIELAGGPRLLYSKRAADHPDRAFSAEGWLTGRPVDNFYMRLGVRWTDTIIRTYPEGVPITDVRTFIGLEIGASI